MRKIKNNIFKPFLNKTAPKSSYRTAPRPSLRSSFKKFFNRNALKTFFLKSIHQSYFVIALALGIIAGVILAVIFRINYFTSPVWLAFVALLLIIAYLKPKLAFIILALLAGFVLAFFRVATELKGENYLRQFYGQEIILTGIVDGDPNPDEEKSTLKLKLKNLHLKTSEETETQTRIQTEAEAQTQIQTRTEAQAKTKTQTQTQAQNLDKVGNEPISIAGAIYVALADDSNKEDVYLSNNDKTTEGLIGDDQENSEDSNINNSENPKISRSDRLTLKGKLESGFGTYAGYLYKPTLTKIEHPNPKDPILETRNWFADRIKSELSEKNANLGLSYLLGMKTGLDKDLDENLRTVGLIHMVVASGTHLSILVGVAKKIFGKLSRFSGLLFATLFILIFMSMVGFTPSILRAGLMSILTLIAWYFGREIAPLRLILFVAATTLLINPMFLVDLGWLLSFASYAGIMLITPRLTKFFYGDKKPKFIASTILATISATLMTLPITLYYFGQVSLISLAANVLLLPTLPFALGLTFATGLVANIPLLSTVISFLTTKLLDFHIGAVDFFAAETSFHIKLDPYQPYFFTLYAIILIPLVIGLIRKKMVKLKEVKSIKLEQGEKYVRT